VIASSFSMRWEQRNLESENPDARCVNISLSGGGSAIFYQVILLLCERLNNFMTAAFSFDTATCR